MLAQDTKKESLNFKLIKEALNALVAAGTGAIAAGGDFATEEDGSNAQVMFWTLLTAQVVERGMNLYYGRSQNALEVTGKAVGASTLATTAYLGATGTLTRSDFVETFAPFTTAIAVIDSIRAAGAAGLDRTGLSGVSRFAADTVLRVGSVFAGVWSGPAMMGGTPTDTAEAAFGIPFAVGTAASALSDKAITWAYGLWSARGVVTDQAADPDGKCTVTQSLLPTV